MPNQWIRKCQLFVGDINSGKGLDLSEMQIRFETTQSDTAAPNTATIKVLNLSDNTSSQILDTKEFNTVLLNAGYQTGSYGLIFAGNVVQVRRGRLDAATKYLELYAADADLNLIASIVHDSIGPNSSLKDDMNMIQRGSALEPEFQKNFSYAPSANGVNVGYASDKVTSVPYYPRGKVRFGMFHDEAYRFARAHQLVFSIQDGKLQFMAKDESLPGTIVPINENTGMIGMPTQTADGIQVTCLLNPEIKTTGLVQLQAADIQTAPIQGLFPGGGAKQQFPVITPGNGTYKVLVTEHKGDTRGNEWYSMLTCLALAS